MYVNNNVWCSDCRMYYARSRLGTNMRGQLVCPFCLNPVEVSE